jgi:PAS domain-containing protein
MATLRRSLRTGTKGRGYRRALNFRQLRPTEEDVNLGGTAGLARRRGLARAVVAAVVVTGILATVAGVTSVSAAERHERTERETARRSDVVTSISSAFTRSVDLLFTARSFVQRADVGPSEAEFERFFQRLAVGSPGTDAYGVGTIARRGDGDQCYVERTAWPSDDPLPAAALLADVCSAKQIAPALWQAADTGDVTAVPDVPWSATTSRPSDFLLLLPMYRPTEELATTRARRLAVSGWVVAMYRGDALVADALGAGGRQFAVEVFGETATGRVPVGEYRPATATAGEWTVQRVREAGVAWDIRLRAPAPSGGASSMQLTVGIAGSLLTLLLAALLWSLLRGRDRAVALAAAAVKNVAESERRFRGLATASPVGIVEFDLDSRCVFANRRLEEIIGRGAEELSGEGWVNVVHPDDLVGFARALPAERDDVVVQARIVRPTATFAGRACAARSSPAIAARSVATSPRSRTSPPRRGRRTRSRTARSTTR